MQARLKTIRATEPNAGIRAEARKRLRKLLSDFAGMVQADALGALLEGDTGATTANDASLSNPQNPAVRRRMKKIERILKAHAREIRSFDIERLDSIIESRLPGWLMAFNAEALAFARWYSRALCVSTTASQRAALRAAGFPPGFMRKRWTVPVGRQYISPQAAAALPDIVETVTNKITTMAANDVRRLQDVLVEGLEHGADIQAVRRVFESTGEYSARKVELWSIDQTNKITSLVSMANSASLGITEGVWVHVPGQYTSRDTHQRMNGKRFKLNEGLFDDNPRVMKHVLPGELIMCRCTYRSILPPDILDAMGKE